MADGTLLHFHAFRHFAAGVLIQRGIALSDEARVLGHESFGTTPQVHA